MLNPPIFSILSKPQTYTPIPVQISALNKNPNNPLNPPIIKKGGATPTP